MSTPEDRREARRGWLISAGFFAAVGLILWLTPGSLNLDVWSRLQLKTPDLAPLFAQSWVVQFHVATVAVALVLGPVQFILRKGTALHRVLGWIWALAMLSTAVATLFIRDMNDGAFSMIHLFSVMTLIGVPSAVWLAQTGRTGAHQRTVIGLYIGLVIAGVTAIAPGRVIWEMFFR